MAIQRMENKRGQVTIFVIIALMIAIGVIVFFMWVRPSLDFKGGPSLGFEGCVKDSITEAVDILEKTTGLGSSGFTYQYKGKDIPYICYTNNFYQTCTVQKPLLKKNFEKALKEMVEDEIQACYTSSINSLKAQGYEVTNGNLKYETLFEPGVIRIPIQAPTTVNSQSFAKLNVEINSPIYEMVMIATSILQQESRFGDSDTAAFMNYHPDYVVLKMKRDDGTTIYTIRSKLFGNEMQFASRSLAWPAGFDR